MNIKKIENTSTTDWKKVKVAWREPNVRDSVKAEMASGENQGTKFMAALIAEICTFDGEKKVYEDLLDMPTFFFNTLFQQVSGFTDEELQALLSASSKEESSDTKK